MLCVNLLDEAKRKGVEIDLEKLSEILSVPVIGTVARKKSTLSNLKNTDGGTNIYTTQIHSETHRNKVNNPEFKHTMPTLEITKL